MRKVYRGSDIEVSFDLDVCVHIGECLRGHPGVFKLDRRPWIVPDEPDADTVGEVVRRCPSGALQYRRLDGGPQEEHSGKAITPIRDGPLLGVRPETRPRQLVSSLHVSCGRRRAGVKMGVVRMRPGRRAPEHAH